MTWPDTPTMSRRLTEERAEAVRRIEALARDVDGVVAAAADVATDDEHDPEGTTLAFERSLAMTLLDRAGSHLSDVDRALARLADGTYHRCERCGEEIAPARLEARPVARTCIACASATPRR